MEESLHWCWKCMVMDPDKGHMENRRYTKRDISQGELYMQHDFMRYCYLVRRSIGCAVSIIDLSYSTAICLAQVPEIRSIDGTSNNLVDLVQGSAGAMLNRHSHPAFYPDGFGDVIDISGRPNARDISNRINVQYASILNNSGLSDWVVQWGQFLAHDMDLADSASDNNMLPTGTTGDFSIAINNSTDPIGPNPLPFNRSNYGSGTGTPTWIPSPSGPVLNARQQINEITS